MTTHTTIRILGHILFAYYAAVSIAILAGCTTLGFLVLITG